MKDILVFLSLISAIFACKSELPDDQSEASLSGEKVSKYIPMLEKFEKLNFDTLSVYNEKDFNKFKGTQLDSTDVLLFPGKIKEDYFNRDQDVFAIGKFTIDNNRTALVARTPSEYSPTSIKLLIYDKRTDVITDYIELANFWGDAGDVSDKASWLFKGAGNEPQLFLSHVQSHDNSIEDPKNKTRSSQSNNYLIRISEKGFDTISRDPKLLAGKFKRVEGKR